MDATNSVTARSVPRAEPVGSLIRPPDIIERFDEIYTDRTTAGRRFVPPDKAAALGDLARVSDGYVAEFVRRQVDAGLDVVTDGEIHRSTFLSSFYDAVDGFAEAAERFQVFDDSGNLIYHGYADPEISGPIRKAASPAVGETAALRSLAPAVPFKITFPAPSYFYTDILQVTGKATYRDRQSFVEDVVEIERQLVAEAIAAGARWIQFDFPVYPGLADSEYAAQLSAQLGEPVEALLARAIEVDGRVTADIPEGVTVAMHICRGNFEGGFWQGSLEPVAERMFNELPHHRFLIEWEDTSREGDYSPLRFVPEDKVVAIGLVSTKTPDLESDDDVVRRLEEASKHLAMDQLALCPQCGFASLVGDRLVKAEDAQWRKLELVGRVADRVWGSS